MKSAPANTSPVSTPTTVAPPDVIQLSSDTESGGDADDANSEGEVTMDDESIADRVAARHRAHFASFDDLL